MQQPPPKIQPNVSRDREAIADHPEFKHFSQQAIHIRAGMQQNWMANDLRNYVSTIERDMDYKQSNQPWTKRFSHAT